MTLIEVTSYLLLAIAICYVMIQSHSGPAMTVVSVYYLISYALTPFLTVYLELERITNTYVNESPETLLFSRLLFPLFFTFQYFAYTMYQRKKVVSKRESKYLWPKKLLGHALYFITKNPIIAQCLALSFVVSSMFLFNTSCIVDFFIREASCEPLMQSKIGWLIVNFFIRPLVVLACVYTILSSLNKPSSLIFWIAIVTLLISGFPAAMPRFMAAAFYMPLVIMAIFWSMPLTSIYWKKIVLVMVLLTGILFISPILNSFRYLETITQDYNSPVDTLLQFDAVTSTILGYGLEYRTYGKSLIDALLFWVPRSLYDAKSITSGLVIGNYYMLPNTNISAPFELEGYFNFGYIGICFFGILSGIILRIIDKRDGWDLIGKNPFGLYICLAFGSYFVILMRGGLMSTFAYFAAFCVCVYLTTSILRFYTTFKST